MFTKNINKFMFVMFSLFLILPFSSIDVNANVSVTYTYKNSQGQLQEDVDFLVFDCLDASCRNVEIPAFVNGDNSGNSNDYLPNYDITVTYPSTQETAYGYSEYHYKDGYLPMEFFVTAHGNLVSNEDITFTKKADCSSHVENFRIINAEKPNLPIQIFVKTKLDATTFSAFSTNPDTPEYVPMQFKDFYSAETKVTLKIYDSNNLVVFSKQQIVNLFMDSSEEIKFEWIPTRAGEYKVVMSTDVTDNQCSSSIPQSVSSEFTVVRTSLDKCYTLINNLRTSVIEPFVSENVEIKASKISNYRDADGDLQALATDVDLKIFDPDGNLINSQFKALPKNSDTVNPVEFSFNWVPSENGLHTIKVHGIANDPICQGKENLDETETMNILVKDQGRIDLNLRMIGNKEINENSELRFGIKADYNGGKELRFSAENLPEGASFNPRTKEFSYKPSYDVVSHSLLNDVLNLVGIDLSKDFLVTFKVTDGTLSDQEIIRIRVIDVNRNPELAFINNIEVKEGDLVKIIPSASDADRDSLKFFFTRPLNSRGEWRTKRGDMGVYFVTVTVKDNFNGQDSQQVKIKVNPVPDKIPLPPEEFVQVKNHKLRTTSLFIENEKVKPGDYLVVYTKIKNDGELDESNVKIRMTIPELGIVEQRAVNSLEINDQRLRIFMINIPLGTKQGFYVLKSQVFNSNSQETEAIEFEVT
ncbi:hypothetical protein HYX18_04520 [Candidatus Woesearchaeota archaeon]|nr:hypothetical protein [Candidatus Woesearchaeota archaeon]